MSKFYKWLDKTLSGIPAFGVHWQSTLGGYALAALVAAYDFVDTHDVSEPKFWLRMLIAVLIALVGRIVPDARKVAIAEGINPDEVDKVAAKIDKDLERLDAAPVPTPVKAEAKPSPFSPDGEKSRIRGSFPVTVAQLANARFPFAPYGKYFVAVVEAAAKYSLNPLFVIADFVNQGVKPEYNNPFGISTDDYPYGEPNGHIKDGPRKFSDKEWPLVIDKHMSLIATGSVYAKCNTIAEWAAVDAPPGAANDVHGTNSSEASEVGALYNKLVKDIS